MKHSLYLFIFLLLALPGYSQEIPARARKAYESAQRHQAKHEWMKAERDINKAIHEYRAYTDAYITYGQWLLDRNQYAAAAQILGEGEKTCPDGAKIFAKSLAQSLMFSGNESGALQRIPSNSKDSFWTKLATQAQFIQNAKRNAGLDHLTPVGPLWGINTPYPELFPSISADGKTFYFTRRMNGIDEDFFFAKPDICGGWQSAKNMGAPPNTLQQEAAQFISADGHYLFFMRCDNRTLSGWDQGGCDLYMSYTADSVWSTGLSFGGTINTPGFEGMPSLSSDNRELYFVSNRPGGYGGLDIWSSRFEHGLWQAPRNLGAGVNTSGDETAPFIYADNLSLYFASTGKTGMGGSDLFLSRKTGDTTWGEAENLGIPVNSPFNEASLSLNAGGDTAYLATDRDSLAGNFDLYEYSLPAQFRPSQVMTMKGIVYDSLAPDSRLNYANIYITDSSTDKELYQVQTNRGDASYTISLPVGRTYFLFTDRIGYQSRNDTFRCDANAAGAVAGKNFALLPFGYEAPVTDSIVGRVYFARNSTTLSDIMRQQILTMIAPWREMPGVSIFVNGYTDNSGTPMLNEQLSYTRAKLVSAAFNSDSFATGVVSVQGWGEANTLVENDSEEHRDMNRRVEIVVRR